MSKTCIPPTPPNLPTHASDRFTWVSIFCFLINLLALVLTSINDFIFYDEPESVNDRFKGKSQRPPANSMSTILTLWLENLQALSRLFALEVDMRNERYTIRFPQYTWEQFFANSAKIIDAKIESHCFRSRDRPVAACLKWISKAQQRKQICLIYTAKFSIFLLSYICSIIFASILATAILFTKVLMMKAGLCSSNTAINAKALQPTPYAHTPIHKPDGSLPRRFSKATSAPELHLGLKAKLEANWSTQTRAPSRLTAAQPYVEPHLGKRTSPGDEARNEAARKKSKKTGKDFKVDVPHAQSSKACRKRCGPGRNASMASTEAAVNMSQDITSRSGNIHTTSSDSGAKSASPSRLSANGAVDPIQTHDWIAALPESGYASAETEGSCTSPQSPKLDVERKASDQDTLRHLKEQTVRSAQTDDVGELIEGLSGLSIFD